MVAQVHLARAEWGPVALGAALMAQSFSLPAGTTTFVSADVDSSALRRVGGDREMGEAMAGIDAVFGVAVGRYGGVRAAGQREPGSFLAAFARPSEALACALDVQCELQANELSCLRAGLHTGEAQVHDEVRYFGQAVARTARLRDLGHPGQVLVSRAVAGLVADHLPTGASLADLGPHRLRDLARPEQIYQLCHADLRSEFPPLSSLDHYPHNLAVQLTSFVGREAEVVEVGGLLASHGLVTITGSGGCGKTRLALQVAAEALGPRADEAWFVDLSGLADPGLVPGAVMAAMGVQEVRDQPHIETLVTWLADRDALVVLDNCEHLLGAAAALAEALVHGCGRLGLLATSREPLGVSGETVWRVPCLSVPQEQGPVDVGVLDASEAVRLFRDRARSARPNFSVTDDNAPAVAAICSRLDGIPLAIELAAARVRMMSVERVAEALADRFHVLAGGRSAVPRHQTLRASVDWSYGLLAELERALLRRLSVFAGGFSLDAAEHVGAAEDVGRYDVLDLLSALVDKSLVQVNDRGDRYRLLDTIKAYAAEELASAGEEVATRDRHLAFFTDLGERAEKGMWTSAMPLWLGVLDTEHDNLRAGLGWGLTTGQVDAAARLVYAISWFFLARCFWAEGRRWYEELLARDLAPARRAELYWWAAAPVSFSDRRACLAYGRAVVDLGRELGDDRATARGLGRVGLAQSLSDPLGALTTLGEALAMARSVGDDHTLVDCLCWSVGADIVLGRLGDALGCAEKALATAKRDDLMWNTAFASAYVAQAAVVLGELDRAADAAASLTMLAEELGDQHLTMRAQLARGVVGMYRSQTWAAEALSAARDLAERTHNDLHLGDVCFWQGALALSVGHDEDGRAILEEAVLLVDNFRPAQGPRGRCLLAEAAVRRGDLAEARRWLDEALALPFPDQLFLATRAKARMARAKGDRHGAWELADEGLRSAHRSGARIAVVDFLELLALVATGTERFVEAGRLLSAANAERDRLGYVRFAVDQPDVDAALARIEAALGVAGLAAAQSEGAALSVEDAVGYASRGRGERGRPSAGWASLTPTERRVAELVTEGLTNSEIGERMFVSTGTVKSHINHIFDKLGVTDRRQLAVAARANA
jgi:predicted ATPase/class 3 adenylate cyclase/DNA-binding CsgD family transcriptional regulator